MRILAITFIGLYLLGGAAGMWAVSHLPWDGSETWHEKVCAHVYMAFSIPTVWLMKTGLAPRLALVVTPAVWALVPSVLLAALWRWRRTGNQEGATGIA